MTAEQYRIYKWISQSRSPLESEMFKLTIDFTLDDWRTIRTKRYWEHLDRIKIPAERLAFQHREILHYLNTKQ